MENSNFWNAKTVSEIADEQRITVVKNIAGLSVDFWPEEESADEFNDFSQQLRRHDRLSE
jgi:hypothetical protein